MATFADMYDFVMTEIRGVETTVVDFNVRKVTRDFLKRTTMWREVLQLPMTVGATAYRLVPHNGGIVAGVLSVGTRDGKFDGMPGLTENRLSAPGYAQQPGDATGWHSLYPNVIEFREAPTEAYTLPIAVYKTLSLDPQDDLIPDEVFDNYAEVLANGIKANLQAMPSKPWTDMTNAQLNNTLYARATNAAIAALRRGGANTPQRVIAPVFAGRSRR